MNIAISILPPNGATRQGFDLDRFWTALYGDSSGYLCIMSGRYEPGQKSLQGVRSEFFLWPHQKEEALTAVEKYAAEGKDVYQSVNLFSAPDRKKENVGLVRVLHVEDINPDRLSLGPKPSIIIDRSYALT